MSSPPLPPSGNPLDLLILVLPGLIWALPYAVVIRLAQRAADVGSYPVAGAVPVSLIVPARNETATIDHLLDTVLASRHAPLEVIVVDDRSTDDTAARVAARAVHDPRLRLVVGQELPTGWLGKPWACAQGASVASGTVLIFTDADTSHHPDLIGHAVSALQSESADLLTLTAHQICTTPWERLVMPQIWALLGWRYPPSGVSNATKPHQVVANGQFIAVSRTGYDAIGGHAAVKGEVVEDLALAQCYLLAGKRLRMLHGESLLSTRMYRSLPEMIEGWSKNLYLGAQQSLRGMPVLARLAPVGLMLGFAYWLVPPFLLLLGIAPLAMTVAICLSLLFWVLISRGMKIPVYYALGYPIGAAMALWIAVRSTLRGAARVEWRGRTYDLRRP
jgi:chlorobactene glucosyltransferase